VADRGIAPVDFNDQVYALVRQVPAGRVITYGAIARLLGQPRKAREVGWAMHTCPDDVPAQRVVNRFGEVTGDPVGDGAAVRRLLLEAEGVQFDQQGRCDLSRYSWEPDPE
jgi:methylated-DNA-protein-cysteine methyltransferase-like protein